MSGFSFAALQQVAKESGFTAIDAGTYDVVIDKAKAGKTQAGGDKITVTFKVIAGVLAGKGTVTNNFNIIPENGKSLWFFFNHMRALGLDDTYFAQNPSIEQVAAALVGRQARITVTDDREWKGAKQNDVSTIEPLAGAPQPMPAVSGGAGVPNVPVSPTAAQNGSGNGTVNVPPPAATPAASVPPVQVPQPAAASASGEGTVSSMPTAPF